MGARTICQEGHTAGAAVPHAHQVKKAKGALPHLQGRPGGAFAPPENPFFCSFPAL
jgi:hypothetical protein